VKRSVCAEALVRDGGWARNDGELGSMWRRPSVVVSFQ
jgi:hypothetical protein